MDPWVFQVLRDGYRVPFVSHPPLSPVLLPPSELFSLFRQGVSSCRCGGRLGGEGCDRTCVLVSRLLQPSLCHSEGYWRSASCHRPYHLNRFVKMSHFCMETPMSALRSLCPQDWMVSIDLQDTYLQVPVHPEFRQFLQFCVGPQTFQFRVLCFGLSTALQVFTCVMAPISSIIHRYSFWILRYLDIWLVLGSSYQEITWARDFLL